MVQGRTYQGPDFVSVAGMDAMPSTVIPPRPPFLERITSRQWQALDVFIAGLFFAGGSLTLLVKSDVVHSLAVSRWILWPLLGLATIPIAVRRRWPEASLALICGAVTIGTILGRSFATLPVVALPLYSVTVKYSRRQSLAILAAVEGVFVLGFAVGAIFRPIPGDFSTAVIVAGATWFVGDSVRTRQGLSAGPCQPRGRATPPRARPSSALHRRRTDGDRSRTPRRDRPQPERHRHSIWGRTIRP